MKRVQIIASAMACMFSITTAPAFAHGHSDCENNKDDDASIAWHSVRGPAVQLLWLDTKPLENLAATDRYLKGYSFDMNQRILPQLGLTSYHESAFGVRTGGGIWAGYKRYESALRRTVDSANVAHDSMAVMRVIPAYAGFTLEKGFRFGIVDAHAGIMLGGGAYIINQEAIDAGNPSVFEKSDSSGSGSSRWGAAGLAIAELNGGILIGLTPVFQIGADGVLNVAYSPEGFGPGYGDFYSVSPGVRVRLLFGK